MKLRTVEDNLSYDAHSGQCAEVVHKWCCIPLGAHQLPQTPQMQVDSGHKTPEGGGSSARVTSLLKCMLLLDKHS